jgi:hypothetical protein
LTNAAQRQDVGRRVLEGFALFRTDRARVDRVMLAIGRRWNWGVVGGAARAWGLSLGDEPRDVDIVVAAPPDRLAAAIRALVDRESSLGNAYSHTSMGGHRLKIDGTTLDIWALSATWAVRTGKIPSHRLSTFGRTAALSIDSLMVTDDGAVYGDDFFSALEAREIRLVYTNVVFPEKLAAKAIRLCAAHRLTPDLALQSFIHRYGGADAAVIVGNEIAGRPRDR